MSKKIRISINGFGRIGRAFFRAAIEREEIEIVAVNDLGDIGNLAYLLKYDSAQGIFPHLIDVKDDRTLLIEGREVSFFSEKDPSSLPWKELNVDVVVESTGFFETYKKSQAHIEAGAKRVVISAPVKDDSSSDIKGETVLVGINEEDLKNCRISSNASCTTNAGSPIVKILNDAVGIKKAMLNTVHAYTASQRIVDGPDGGDWRRGRAGAHNIVPSTTGAAKATTLVIKELEGRFDGVAIRVPVISGSIADITFLSERQTSADEINNILKEAASTDQWRDIFSVTEEPLVSSDIVGARHASIADLSLTKVVDGDLVKVLAWYDNEMSYTYTLLDHVVKAGQLLRR